MTDYNYSVSDIVHVISNIDKCIGYYTRLFETASTRHEKEFWDGYISGLKRAKYLLVVLRNKVWYPPRKINYKEEK